MFDILFLFTKFTYCYNSQTAHVYSLLHHCNNQSPDWINISEKKLNVNFSHYFRIQLNTYILINRIFIYMVVYTVTKLRNLMSYCIIVGGKDIKLRLVFNYNCAKIYITGNSSCVLRKINTTD